MKVRELIKLLTWMDHKREIDPEEEVAVVIDRPDRIRKEISNAMQQIAVMAYDNPITRQDSDAAADQIKLPETAKIKSVEYIKTVSPRLRIVVE